MRKSILAMAALALCATVAGKAQALPLAGAGALPAAANQVSPAETVQFRIHAGRRYCFYPDGWHGAGWYRCGYNWRRGYGWGGIYGWNDWDVPGWGGGYWYGGRHHRHHRGGWAGNPPHNRSGSIGRPSRGTTGIGGSFRGGSDAPAMSAPSGGGGGGRAGGGGGAPAGGGGGGAPAGGGGKPHD